MAENIFSKLLPKGLTFWQKNQSVVGVDIGASSVKIAQLKKDKEQAVLETYGEISTGPYSNLPVGQIALLPEEKITAMLKDLFKESGVTAKDAIVAIPVKSSFVTSIKVPLVVDRNMDEIVRFEARKYVPVPLSEVEMDWWVLNEGKGGEEETADYGEEEKVGKVLGESSIAKEGKRQVVEVLLVVIHKEIIQKYHSVVTKAGMNIKFFEIELFSSWRSSVSLRLAAPVLIIDFGASSTKMSVVDKGILRMTHTIPKGSQAITSAIAKSLKISFERAEEMKHQIGLSSKPEYSELVSVIESVTSFIFAEIKQFMLSYHRKYNVAIGRVALAGGGALLTGFVDASVKNLGIEVILADPFAKTEYPPFLQEALRDIGPSFCNSVGLALRDLE